jgi:hypothetical protein
MEHGNGPPLGWGGVGCGGGGGRVGGTSRKSI